MTKLTPLISIILLTILGCNPGGQNVDTKTRLLPEPDLIERLKGQKAQIDTLFQRNPNEIKVFALIEGDQIPIEINDQNLPDKVVTTFNLLRDSTGRVITISEFPFSESGDWYIELTHYFDNQGKTFAFERQTNFFNSICAEIAFETVTEFYDSDFNRVDSIYQLIDRDNKELKRDNCQFPYDYEYSVVKESDIILKREKIKNGR
ncbi:hypothetical protein [Cyclobacterium marinum]|uniref:Lipoprotein n=1 Tax=Cyclobacterium marinum (strain ATCC 25205 / DSM 745 / LMG 13164 / NCIMB 1802) TaxID=880070 RepID=G0J058_CYCMS|nr:hypothetical protein [Cyclobacterium marinum]AEL27319.1 hypothetical protein Cycma_3602 [Cyclobacterium marinum DSM 745]